MLRDAGDDIPEIRQQAEALIELKMPDILKHMIHADERLLMDTDPIVYHTMMTMLEPRFASTLAAGVTPQLRREFNETLRRIFSVNIRSDFPIALKLAIADQQEMYIPSTTAVAQRYFSERCPVEAFFEASTTLAEVLFENGVRRLENMETCVAIIRSLPSCAITPESVARAIAMLSGCHVYVTSVSRKAARRVTSDDGTSSEVQFVDNRGVRLIGSSDPYDSDEEPVDDISDDGSLDGDEHDQMDAALDTEMPELLWLTGGRNATEASATKRVCMLNFVGAVLQLAPHLKWPEVVYELDHEGFFVPHRGSFHALMLGLVHGLQNSQFPVELFCRHWAHTSAQLSFFAQALRNRDLFDFYKLQASFQCVRLESGQVKGAAERLKKYNLECFQILDLVETLLFLGDAGFKSLIQEIFDEAVQAVPDVLALTLIQLSPSAAMSQLRQELSRSCFQRCVACNLNVPAIIQSAWQSTSSNQAYRNIFNEAMAEWYIMGECSQMRLTQIIDVAQKMKILGDVLNSDVHHFVIDLAVLASRRDYLKLDQWLELKMRNHRIRFLGPMLKFFERRCPTLLTGEYLFYNYSNSVFEME